MIANVPERLYREFFTENPNAYMFPEVPNRNLVEFMKRFAEGKRSMKVIDLGCGEGRSSVFLAAEAVDVLAVDLSPTIVKKGRERFGKQERVDYCVAEIASLPLGCELFDLAVDITTLNNQKSRKRTRYIKEIRRVLKKEGYYYVSAVSTKDPSCKENCPKRHFTLRKSGSYRQFYSTENLRKLLSPYFNIIGIKERKDGVSDSDEFESIEIIAKK